MDVFAFDEGGVAGDSFGLWPTEGFDFVALWTLLEDISAVEFGVGEPNLVDIAGVGFAVEAGDVVVVVVGEGKGACVVEHTQEFDTAASDEALVDLGLLLALGFAEEDDGFHSQASAPSLA